jgi:hypothetical protein
MSGQVSIQLGNEPAGLSKPDPIVNPIVTPSTKSTVSIDKPEVKPNKATDKPLDKPNDKQVDRPSWLPEKFKTPEDMAKSYAELESKLSKPDKKPEDKPVKKEDPKPEKKEDLAIQDNKEPVTEPDPDTFINKYSEEFMTNGSISEDSYKELATKGYSKKMVDSFIAGQQAILAQNTNQVYSLAGGQEGYAEMTNWAAQNLDKSDIEAYNKAVNSGDMSMITMAVKGLSAQFKAAQGPNLIQGSHNVGNTGFASRAELAKAIADPQYKKDPGYRRLVEEKLSRSKFD